MDDPRAIGHGRKIADPAIEDRMLALDVALTVAEKRTMSATEIVRRCPHDPDVKNPCDCGIEWRRDIDGDWAIQTRWPEWSGR